MKEGGISTEKYKKKIYDFMMNYDNNKAIVLKSIEGIVLCELNYNKEDSLVDLISSSSTIIIDPMPNLYFTRDPFACIGNGVSINKMYSQTRNRETIYGEYIFKYHPDYKDRVGKYYNRNNPFHIEGGDILNLSDKVLAVGVSQRTEADAVEMLAKNIFSNEDATIDTILAFDIPNSRAFMHLDTVFTQIDRDKFTIHPGILEPLVVYEMKRGKRIDAIAVKKVGDKLESILQKYLDLEKVTMIKCGGEKPYCIRKRTVERRIKYIMSCSR